ncbi:helix-turn-helix transcriptional regulator [Nonomuraea sp. NPDC051191]|uniref:helix-turn-helix transcriptional regulator n=1 Tax=Nonomuraea sp. NPDC051191 TaxID=3364372 RepID=UPI0037A1E03C
MFRLIRAGEGEAMTDVLEAAGLEAAGVVLRRQYTSMRLSASGEQPRLRIEQQHLGAVRLDRVSVQAALEADCEPLGTLCVGRLRSGRLRYRSGREEVLHRPGEVFLAAQPGRPFQTSLRDLACDVAVLDPVLLGDVAAELAAPSGQAPSASGGGGRVRLLSHRPVSREAGVLWTRTYAYVHSAVAGNPHAMHSPLILAQAARHLAAVTLSVFPYTTAAEPAHLAGRDAHRDTLRRAIAYLEAHADQDITVADIAEAAHVTVRTIQLAFRRHLDTTPLGYLRRIRLHHAHDDLRAADPGRGDSVAAIAARWGFAHPGRFAALYRREFGRSPGLTLHG